MTRPRNPERVFTRKPPDRRLLTSESIATDIEAFEAAGGAIEVLGTTQRLKHIGEQEQPQEMVSGTIWSEKGSENISV